MSAQEGMAALILGLMGASMLLAAYDASRGDRR